MKKLATELNELMGLEPPIDVKAKSADLKEKILEAADNLIPEDKEELSAEALKTLKKLGITLDGDKKSDEKLKAKKDAKPAAKNKEKTRMGVMKMILQESNKTPMTRDEMVKQMHEKYGGSEIAAKNEVRMFIRILSELDLFVEVNDDKDDKLSFRQGE